MFIDVHAHTRLNDMMPTRPDGELAFPPPEFLIKKYDELGIERGVLLPGAGAPECEIVPQSNEEVIRISREYEGRFIPFCNNVDPRALSNSHDAPLGHLLEQVRRCFIQPVWSWMIIVDCDGRGGMLLPIWLGNGNNTMIPIKVGGMKT